MSGNATQSITVPAGETTGTNVNQAVATADGFIAGVEPAKTPEQLRQEAAASQQVQTPPDQRPQHTQQQTTGERLFSADEVESFRQQEKEKVYGRVESLESELQKLQAEREAERARVEEERKAVEEAAKREAEEGMEAKDLVRQVREELQAEISATRQEAEMAKVMLEKERELAQINAYRQQAIAAVETRLVPEIADFISGDSPEQIDASIADALERSDRIVQGMMAAQQQQLQGMRGARVTAPTGNGPLEEQQEQRQMSVEDIRKMSPSEYAASRGILQQAGRAQFYGQR